MRLALYPSFGADAWAYRNYALGFRKDGFLHELGSIRTYGYPAFLYLLSFLVPSDGRGLWLCAGLVQYSIFLVASLWLANLVWRFDRKLGCAMLLGLLLNPFLISVVVDCLSEALIAPIGVSLAAFSLVATTFSGRSSTIASTAAGTLLSCFALMVRPAALPLVVAWNGVAILTIWWNRYFTAPGSLLRSLMSISARIRATWFYAVILVAAASVTWTPQIYYNYTTWGRMSPLPVCRFDLVQVPLSILALRGDSVVNDASINLLTYENPFSSATQTINRHPINWYVENWRPALETIVLRLLLGLSINHLFTYIYPGPKLVEIVWLLASWTIICFGVLRLYDLVKDFTTGLKWDCNGAAAFVAALTIGTVSLNSFTVIELRFNLIPLAVLSVFGIDGILRNKQLQVSLFALGAACVLTVFSQLMLSALIVTGSPKAGPQYTYTLPPLNCFTFAWEANTRPP